MALNTRAQSLVNDAHQASLATLWSTPIRSTITVQIWHSAISQVLRSGSVAYGQLPSELVRFVCCLQVISDSPWSTVYSVIVAQWLSWLSPNSTVSLSAISHTSANAQPSKAHQRSTFIVPGHSGHLPLLPNHTRPRVFRSTLLPSLTILPSQAPCLRPLRARHLVPRPRTSTQSLTPP